MRFYLLLLVVVALWATFTLASPVAESEEALLGEVSAADALLDADAGQEHENVGEREARQSRGGHYNRYRYKYRRG